MSVQNVRSKTIKETMDRIRAIAAQGVDRASLELIAAELRQLAAHADWFPLEEFPSAVAEAGPDAPSSRYMLHKEDDDSFALYLNSLNPGKNSAPHNHGTWAVIVGLDGEELNRVYARTDDRSDPQRATLAVRKEIVVRPGGDHAAFLDDDIHSIHVQGQRATRQFHLYGRALETLTERQGYDLETGLVSNYNKRHFKPGHDARA